MKRIFIILVGMLMAIFAYSQTVQKQKWTESFDGIVSFTATPSSSWVSDVTYHVLDSSVINPKSYLGLVPSNPGDMAILQTDIYDCSLYDYVLLRFSHICKVSPQDIVRIEYRIDMGVGMGAWNSIPTATYMGKASNFKITGFNAASYPEWQANDSLLHPSLSQSWWKEETFDLEIEAKNSKVQFRFVIIHGKQPGTQASYGWLIDNFELVAATHQLYSPFVEFIAPLIKDTVYNTGPWEINAKVKTQTNRGILNPYLKYAATLNGAILAEDSLLMDNVEGDSLWKASIPQFVIGTKVVYSITGIDSVGNLKTAESEYDIIRDCKQGGESGSENCVDEPYSVLAYSIDMSDTIVISPTTTILPIVASVKNVGNLDMNLVTVWYTVNGSSPVSKTWSFNQAVPWDMNYQDTAGTYSPKVNTFDTIMVWVKMPNGQTDPLFNDDTVTKVIYISGDIQAKLISSVTDTTFTTGTHEIKAKIRSITGASLPPIRLYVSSTYQNVPAYDTLNMILDMSDNVWKVTIPHYRFGTDVSYSIKLKDTLGNDIVLSDSYHIKRFGCTTVDGPKGGVASLHEFFYTGNVQTVMLDVGYYRIECWGADGGDGTVGTVFGDSKGGKGGYSSGTYMIGTISPLYIYVGGKGQSANTNTATILDGEGGWNGGGWGGNGSANTYYKGGGGGGTDVRTTQNTTYTNRIIVAGGGGGAGGAGSIELAGNGGNGGGLTGQDGILGASQGITHNGKGGTQNQGGAAATYNAGATAGSFGVGGNGCTLNGNILPAGGGGGGWYGGGGGSTQGGSGGGGSGYIGGVTDAITAQLSETGFITNPTVTGNGYVRITFLKPLTNLGTLNCLDHSVGLNSINNLNAAIVTAGMGMPVHVSIRNRGVEKLDSCYINWSLNGVIQPGTTVYRGKDMLEDFSDTITIGYYMPGLLSAVGQRDTIKAWVSMPNGQVDAYAGDDTLTVSFLVCPDMKNNINIPNDFTSVDAAIKAMLNCGISGKVILEIDPGNYGMLDLSVLKNTLTTKDTLVIRSSTGIASGVVFASTSGNPAMRINAIRNLYVEHITLDAASGTHGVEILGQCDNVEFNSCIINASTSTPNYASDGCGVYYYGSSSSPSMGNIRLLNNQINNGYSGIYFYYLNPSTAVQSASTSWVRIRGNTIENPYAHGLYLYNYGRFDSIAYNTINTRAVVTTQYGMYLYYYNRVNDGVIGNKINIRGTSTSYGIYANYLNSSSTGAGNPVLIANNEIRRLSGTGTFYGLTQYYNVASYFHNSVYCQGTGSGANYAMYLYYTRLTEPCTIKNNLFVSAGTGTGNNYALYCPTAANATPAVGTIIDYNNYYSAKATLSNLGATLPLLQTATQQDANSVNINPDFLNIANSLALKNSAGLMVPRMASVSEDIDGESRLSATAVGAYERSPLKHDLMLLEFASGENDVVKGQTVQVSVDGQNLGAPITAAIFGWSVNGVNQTPSSWTPIPALGSFAQQTIPIGSFVATGADTFHVVVWVETVNGQADEETWNDTVSTLIFIAPLAEFVAPFISDTTVSLSFDINVKIRKGSGGAVNTPEMYIETEMDGYGSCYIHTFDTVTMVQEGDKWVANIPKQYYGSKVIYETRISDAIGNNVILKDSTCITIGGGNKDVYASNNLAIFNLVSPKNIQDGGCTNPSSPVEIELLNLGENDYDFMKVNTMIGYAITSPQRNYSGNITINTGELLSGSGKIIELLSTIPIVAGSYTIKAWVTSSIDNFSCDDTLSAVYVPSLIGLPVDEDFSDNVLSSDFESKPVTGTETWLPYSDTNFLILPPSGNGMLWYAGSNGSMSILTTTRQLDLNGTVNPKLDFWYYHDTTLPATDRSYTDVNVIVDGVRNLVQTLFKKDTVHGWKQYTVELKNYTNGQCVFIQFESMNKSELQLPQYIGHITITSTPDLAVSEIIISPEISVCALTNKELKVVLTTNMSQAIDFARDTTSLIVETTDSTYTIPLQDVIAGNSSDTVLIASNLNFSKGLHSIRAYLKTPVDNYPLNDSISWIKDINPALSVTITPITDANSCIKKSMEVEQKVTLKNTGDMDIPEIELLLLIDVIPPQIFKDTLSIPLKVGESTEYTFTEKYIVPAEVDYPVRVLAWMKCDSALVNTLFEIQECVDLHNVSVVSIDNPSSQTDTVGSTENIVVTIKNESDNKRYSNVVVTALIENEQGEMLASRLGTISMLEPLETEQFTFTEKYTIPDDSVYSIRVWINSLDMYPEDDTSTVKRYTAVRDTITTSIKPLGAINVFTLAQNIPNPATNSTRIDYNVPEAGEVIFYVHSITGQLLYSKTIETERGTNSLELNTSTFAAGVYFYSMEYKGQKRVKQLIVNN